MSYSKARKFCEISNEVCDRLNVPHGSIVDQHRNIYTKSSVEMTPEIEKEFKEFGSISDELCDFINLPYGSIVDYDVIREGILKYFEEHKDTITYCGGCSHTWEILDEKARKLFDMKDDEKTVLFITFNEVPLKHWTYFDFDPLDSTSQNKVKN